MDHIKKFNNYTVEDFSKFHDESFSKSSPSTKKTMKGSLKRIEKIWDKPLEKLELIYLMDADDTYNYLKASKYSNNTQLQTFTNILKILKLVDAPLAHYNKFLRKLNLEGKRREEQENQSLTDKLKIYPPYSDIKNLVENHIDTMLNDLSNINFYEIKMLIVLSIFTLSVPMRTSNYIKMKIKYFTPDELDDSNYFIDDENDIYTFIYNHESIIVTNTKLKKLIKIWLHEFNTSSYFLINNDLSTNPMNTKDINMSLSMSSKNLLGINLSAGDLRSIYMKYLMTLDPNFKQKIILSNIMGYQNISKLEKHI
mgnify:FL=1